MAEAVNYLVQLAKSFLTAIGNHKAEFAAKSFAEDRIKRLEDKTSDLEKKDSDQKAAEKLLSELTDQQNDIAERALGIMSAQNAGQSGLGKSAATNKEFMIGKVRGGNVTKLMESLRSFVGVGLKYHDLLVANGMSEEQVASIGTLYGELAAIDAKQENQKKLRNIATMARDSALKNLKDEIFRTKKFVKSAFQGNKAIQEEFKPIGRPGKGKGGSEKNAPPSASAPQVRQ